MYEPNRAPLLGLAAKPFAPVVPLSVLTLAGALPDVVFFILQFFGVETFNFDPTLQRRGCFPYSNEYPYSHSLLGMVVAGNFGRRSIQRWTFTHYDQSGVILAILYKGSTSAPVTWKDQAAIVTASASHFLLEWPAHRSGMFDFPVTGATNMAL